MNYFRVETVKVRQSVAVATLRSNLAVYAENKYFRLRNLHKDSY